MSTQAPITTEPTACSTNWLTKLACKIQGIVEPFCEKRSDFELNLYEQNTIAKDARNIDSVLHIYVCTSFQLEQTTANGVFTAVENWGKKTGQSPAWSAEVNTILAPRLTLWNKLGLSAWKAFSVGTECSCCWGWRVILSFLTVLSIGYLTGKYL